MLFRVPYSKASSDALRRYVNWYATNNPSISGVIQKMESWMNGEKPLEICQKNGGVTALQRPMIVSQCLVPQISLLASSDYAPYHLNLKFRQFPSRTNTTFFLGSSPIFTPLVQERTGFLRYLQTLGDLLRSMTQYHASNRPSATEVLKHPWFQRCPSLVGVSGPTEEEEALADLETLKSLKLDPNTVISSNFLQRWYKRG